MAWWISGVVKFGGESLMVQGCMTTQDVGHMCKMDRRVDPELHISILQAEFLATVEFHGLDGMQLG